jgi:hypothetical protein
MFNRARRRGRRRPSTRATGLLVAVVAAMAALGAFVASAAVPTFPNNVVVFPDRDFVTIEGYQDHIGETALVEVTRNGSVVGSAKSVVAEGDVAFEINHPGGVCWGNDTDLKVTPDIRPGDKVSISFAAGEPDDTIVQDTYVTGDPVRDGRTVTISGFVGPNVNTARMEQRVVNPDLVDTGIGRRDVRALPGPLTPSDKGGYSSSLAFDGDRFIATYIFDDLAVAEMVAGGGGERIMGWQEEDAAGNRQGLTISEFGELGGPGMGGCPAGPADQAAPQPGSAAVVRSDDKTSMIVTWTPATPQPGAEPVTGYNVEAVAKTTSALGFATVGRRTAEGTTRTTITGLDPAEQYDVEVRSLAGARMSEAFTVQAPAAPEGGDQDAPDVSATPAGGADSASAVETGSVELSSTDATADVYFTLDGSEVITAGLPSDSAQLYTGPIPISETTLLKYVAFDAAGNTTVGQGWYKPTPLKVPAAPTDFTGTAGQASVTLRWSSSDPSITQYGVTVYDLNGAVVGTPALRLTTAKSMTIDKLEVGKDYFFTVQAKNNAGWGERTAKLGPLTPTKITDQVTITRATWKSGEFRVRGTGSVTGAIVTVRPATPSGAIDRTRSLGSATVGAPVAPATVGDYEVRMRNANAPATNPGRIYVESDNGGVAGPAVVSNG